MLFTFLLGVFCVVSTINANTFYSSNAEDQIIYVAGIGGDWTKREDRRLKHINGNWYALDYVDFSSGNEFKINDGTWNNSFGFSNVKTGDCHSYTISNKGGNIGIDNAFDGNVSKTASIYVNFKGWSDNSGTEIFVIRPFVLCGAFSNASWDLNSEYYRFIFDCSNDWQYVLKNVKLSQNCEFKSTTLGSWNWYCGYNEVNKTGSFTFDRGDNDNIKMTSATGYYSIYLKYNQGFKLYIADGGNVTDKSNRYIDANSNDICTVWSNGFKENNGAYLGVGKSINYSNSCTPVYSINECCRVTGQYWIGEARLDLEDKIAKSEQCNGYWITNDDSASSGGITFRFTINSTAAYSSAYLGIFAETSETGSNASLYKDSSLIGTYNLNAYHRIENIPYSGKTRVGYEIMLPISLSIGINNFYLKLGKDMGNSYDSYKIIADSFFVSPCASYSNSNNDVTVTTSVNNSAFGQVTSTLVNNKAPYTSSYSVNANVISISDPSFPSNKTLTASALNPVGYHNVSFNGWSNHTTGEEGYLYENISFTANFIGTANRYSISYDLSGGTVGQDSPTSATYDSVISVPNPTRTGFAFQGWQVSEGLNTATAKWGTNSNPTTSIDSASTICYNGTNPVYFKNITPTNEGNITLKAVWQGSNLTISYDANNGQGTMTDTSAIAGQEISLPECTFTREGYSFLGWSTNPNDSFIEYHETQKVSFTSNTILYAVWNEFIPENVRIVLDTNRAGSDNFHWYDKINNENPDMWVWNGFSDTESQKQSNNFHKMTETAEGSHVYTLTLKARYVFNAFETAPDGSTYIRFLRCVKDYTPTDNVLNENILAVANKDKSGTGGYSNVRSNTDTFTKSYDLYKWNTIGASDLNTTWADTDFKNITDNFIDETNKTIHYGNTSTMRIWCRGTQDSWYAANAMTGIRAWGGVLTTPTVYVCASIENNLEEGKEGLYFWYADIPTNVTNYQFVRINPAKLDYSYYEVWNYSKDFYYDTSTQPSGEISMISSPTYKVHYINNIVGNEYTVTLGNENSVNAVFASKVLEGYCSCVRSETNGYLATNEFTDNYYNRMNETEKSKFATINILDFANQSSSSKEAYVNALSKYNMMQSMNITYSTNIFNKLAETFTTKEGIAKIIAITSLIAVSISGIIIYKAKRKRA